MHAAAACFNVHSFHFMHAHDFTQHACHVMFSLRCFVSCIKMFSLLTKKVTYVVKSLEEIAMSKSEVNRAILFKMSY